MAEARRAYDAALAERVLGMEERPELVVLAGWMHVFSAPFLEPLQRAGVKVINLHPALPGESCPSVPSVGYVWRTVANACDRRVRRSWYVPFSPLPLYPFTLPLHLPPHPSADQSLLTPPGAIERAHADLVAGKTTRTGIMVHYVVLEVDRGDAILTQEIPFAGESLPELEEKIHACEHGLIVSAAAKVAGEIIGQRAK